jgi:hypothetical protein
MHIKNKRKIRELASFRSNEGVVYKVESAWVSGRRLTMLAVPLAWFWAYRRQPFPLTDVRLDRGNVRLAGHSSGIITAGTLAIAFSRLETITACSYERLPEMKRLRYSVGAMPYCCTNARRKLSGLRKPTESAMFSTV